MNMLLQQVMGSIDDSVVQFQSSGFGGLLGSLFGKH